MYRTVDQIDGILETFAEWFSALCKTVELPERSVEGRKVLALRMRAGSTSGSRRAVLVVGGTHARELMNPDAIIELIADLIGSYLGASDLHFGSAKFTSTEIGIILESMDLWFVPCVNPDGRNHVMSSDDMWRKNRRLNTGSSCVGVDLNRNANIVWGVISGHVSCSPCSDVYCGPSAFSEPEGRNVKHLLDTERVVSFLDMHSYSELILFPWGHAQTQTNNPSQQFPTLSTGTCAESIPASYKEYMPPIDFQRFTTVAARIKEKISAVRGRIYTPQSSWHLYPTTGTQASYAYSRHIADSNLTRTYGFTIETGPPNPAGQAESFHPSDPGPIKLDAKAAMLAAIQQSVCAIELIGTEPFGVKLNVDSLRHLRDSILAATSAGRKWIALFERVQFSVLPILVRNPTLLADAWSLIKVAAAAVRDKGAMISEPDTKRASSLLKKLIAKSRHPEVKSDLISVLNHFNAMRGKPVGVITESLLRVKPTIANVTNKTKSRRKANKSKAHI
jgi:murein tripeptide amidase MpaA